MVKSRRKKKMALQGEAGYIQAVLPLSSALSLKMEAFHISSLPCSPLHLKSEPDDDNYYSPKLEKSLKRERDDDNE